MVPLLPAWWISVSFYGGFNIYATVSRVWCSPGHYTRAIAVHSLYRTSPRCNTAVGSHGLESMFYADDVQIYIAINDPKHSVDLVEVLRGCINDVFAWNTKNMFKCNPTKTEILHFTSHFNRQASVFETLLLANTPVKVKTKAKNFGVIFDKTLSFAEHINKMCKKARYALRSFGCIRKYLPFDGWKTLVNSFVISRLDYCNSLLYDIPEYQRDKLQRIQNTAARMITGARSSDYITPILKSLHWLPVEVRINFKIVLITYKILNGQSAGYLEPLIKEYHPPRALRSSSRSVLCTPAVKSKTYGGRAFSILAPQLWNAIPGYVKNAESVVSFKTKLKTLLFRKFCY